MIKILYLGSVWKVRHLTYNIRKAITVLPERVVKRVLRRAFDVWESQSPLKFIFKPRGKVDIQILFAKGAHGDGEPFDGKGMLLCYSVDIDSNQKIVFIVKK